MEFEARKYKDLELRNYIFQVIDRPFLETILCKETSKDIWDSMKKINKVLSEVCTVSNLEKTFQDVVDEGRSVCNELMC